MLNEKQQGALASAKNLDFASALRDICKEIAESNAPAALIEGAVLAISASKSLPPMEQSRRVTILLKELPAAILTDVECLERLAALPDHLLTGIAGALPPENLSALFGKRKAQDAGSKSLPVSAPAATQPSNQCARSQGPSSVVEGRGEASSNATVLLLSPLDNQDGNRSLLDSAGFPAYRVTTDDELNTSLHAEDICGFVIDGSFWADKTPPEQEEALLRIVEYSSLGCIFIDRTGFHDPGRITRLVNEARLSSASYTQCQLRDTSVITEGDLPCFEAASALVSSATRPQFIPAELTEPELVALTAAAAAFYKEKCYGVAEPLRTLTLRSIDGGRSGVKLFLLGFNRKGVPVVAKVGPRVDIVGEVERFNLYISRFDTLLSPLFHYHCEVGVIIFGLVEDARQPFKIAPTLEARLQEIWWGEVWPEGHNIEQECEAVASIIERTCLKLEALNRHECRADRLSSFAYLRGSSLRDLSAKGMEWNLPFEGSKSLEGCIDAAHEIVEPNYLKATVHGDIHLRNILARDLNDAFLIDYACSGPGHPAYDLARLECCMYFQFLRPVDTEESFVELQRAISVHWAGYDELERDFGRWHSSALNRTLLKGALLCRDKCLEVLKVYGLGKRDYLAAKFILACLSVSIPNLQFGFIRSTIRALAPEF